MELHLLANPSARVCFQWGMHIEGLKTPSPTEVESYHDSKGYGSYTTYSQLMLKVTLDTLAGLEEPGCGLAMAKPIIS